MPIAGENIYKVETADCSGPMGPEDFILNTFSQVSIDLMAFLSNLEDTPGEFLVLGGKTMLTSQKGTLLRVTTCLASNEVRVNMLSLRCLET